MVPEVLDISDMVQPDYEPKKAHEWVLNIDGVDAWVVRTTSRPSFSVEEIEIGYINQRQYHPGKGEWDSIDVELLDVLAPSTSEKLMVWLRQIHNDQTGQDGYRSAITRDVKLKLIGPEGTVIETWDLINAWPTSIDFGATGLDHDSSDVLNISLTLRFDYALLEVSE